MKTVEIISKKNESTYQEEGQFIISNFSGYIKPEVFRELCMRTIELMKEKRAAKVLVDNSALQVMPSENQEWIQQIWFPQALQAGLKRIAFVIPENIFGKASMENSNKEAASAPIDMKYFETAEQALTWLNV